MTRRPRPAAEPALLAAFRARKELRAVRALDAAPAVNTAACYRRVSTGGQDADNQRADVARVVRARGLELVRDYVETASATARTRPAFEQMLNDARAGTFKVLVIWALDRVGRSLSRNLAAMVELDRLGVQVVSVREPWLDTGGPVRELLIAIFSWVAEFERRRLGERTRAGLERARSKGTRLGRPRRVISPRELARGRELVRSGMPIRVVAQRLRIPRATIHRALADVSKTVDDSGGGKVRAKRGARGASKKRTFGGR